MQEIQMVKDKSWVEGLGDSGSEGLTGDSGSECICGTEESGIGDGGSLI
jgi:hypothetical protein